MAPRSIDDRSMIGVIARPEEHDIVREFFELFKTPWEFYRGDRQYEVLLCSEPVDVTGTGARLVVVYSGEAAPLDGQAVINSQRTTTRLSYKGRPLPIYGRSVTFPRKPNSVLTDEISGGSAAYVVSSNSGTIARIGYDLFGEIRTALTVGQPLENAEIPVVEMHISLLRDVVLDCAIPLIEIPPMPDGYNFIACLTHDVDHPSIRRHKWDHTMFGFLYRAVLGSLINVVRGRTSMRSLFKNWAAALRLPLVHSGLAKDFWSEFDRYTELE